MYGVSDVQGTSTSIVPKAERVWGAMVKVSVLGTLLAAYLPPVVMVTTGLETLRLVLVGVLKFHDLYFFVTGSIDTFYDFN